MKNQTLSKDSTPIHELSDPTTGTPSLSLTRNIVENAGFQVLNGGIGGIVSVLYTSLISHHLGVSDFGVFSLVISQVLLFYGFTSWGAVSVSMRKMAQNPEEEAVWLGNLFFMKSFVAVAIYLVCLISALFSKMPNAAILGTLLYATIILFAPFEALSTVYQVRLNTKIPVLITLSCQILMLLATLIVLQQGGGLLSILCIAMIGHMLRCAGMGIFIGGIVRIPVQFSFEHWKILVREGLPIGLAALAPQIILRLAPIAVSHFHTMQAVGVFSAANRFVSFSFFIPQAIMVPVFPLLCRYWKQDQERLQTLLQRTTDVLGILAVPIFLTCWMIPEPILRILFGPSFAGTGLTLRILAVQLFLVYISMPIGMMLVAAGEQKRSLAINAFGTMVGLLLLYFLVPPFGARGAGGAVSGMALATFVPTLFSIRSLGIRMRWGVLLKTMLCGVLTFMMVGVIAPWHTLWKESLILILFPLSMMFVFGWTWRQTLHTRVREFWAGLGPRTYLPRRALSYQLSPHAANRKAISTLSICIVNYNTSNFLQECLRSIYKTPTSFPLEVIVVDNHSMDGSVDMVRHEFPQVRLIDNATNLYFHVANNQAIEASTGEYIFILNPDTVVNRDVLESLVAYLKSHPQAAGVTCRMNYPDGVFQQHCFRFETLWEAFLLETPLGTLFRSSRQKAYDRLHYAGKDWGKQFVVESVAGACFMVRRSVLFDIGGFDCQMLLYAGDYELCWRIQQTGKSIDYMPHVAIQHFGGGSLDRVQHLILDIHQSDLDTYYIKRFGKFWGYGLGILRRLRSSVLRWGVQWGMTRWAGVLQSPYRRATTTTAAKNAA